MTKILIVDDEPVNIYMLRILLSTSGYDLLIAANGVMALEVAHQDPPDAVISDILMPVMDGFTLCHHWKADEQLKHIPFIFYTATYTDPKDEELALSLGADRFIVKPSEPSEFLKILDEVLKQPAAATRTEAGEAQAYYKEYNETLFRKLESKMKQVNLAHQRLGVLYQASHDLTALKPESELTSIALRAIVELIPTAQAAYFSYSSDPMQFVLTDAVGISDAVRDALSHPLSPDKNSGLIGLVASTREPLVVQDIAREPRWEPFDYAIHSAMVIPVMVEQDFLGGLLILSDRVKWFNEDDKYHVSTLANNLAIAIQNSRLFEHVRNSERYYRTILESSADAIVGLDPKQKVTIWNRGAELLFGYSREETVGKPLDALISPQENNRMETVLKTAEKKGFVSGYQTQKQTKAKKPVDLEMTVTYQGPQLGYTTILRDITERKRKEQESETIATISSTLRRAQTRAELQSMILAELMIYLKADGAAFTRPVGRDDELVVELAAGIFTSSVGKRFLPEMELKSPVTLYGKRVFADSSPIGQKQRPWTMTSVPLTINKETIGSLWIGREAPMSEHEMRLIRSVADIAANAINRVTLHEQTEKVVQELAEAYETTLEGWSHALDLRDRETKGHSIRVTEMCLALARAYGMSDEELVHVRRGALLHDIGKMGIPDSILLKPGALTDEEWTIMRKHPVYAHELLSNIAYLRPALDIPYCHHEKWDGSGYPRGLAGEQIPLAARVFAVADVWDALLSDRPYRPAWEERKVLEYIRAQSGRHFSPQVVESFFRLRNGR